MFATAYESLTDLLVFTFLGIIAIVAAIIFIPCEKTLRILEVRRCFRINFFGLLGFVVLIIYKSINGVIQF